MIIKLNEEYSIVCNWKDRRSGFKHIATILKNGFVEYETKELYENRTWESFEFETVIKKAINNYFDEPLKSEFLALVTWENLKNINKI